jgi:hypothetical protein
MGHGVIGDDEIDARRAAEDLYGAVGVSRRVNAIAFVLKEGSSEGTNVRVIIDYKNGVAFRASGCLGLRTHYFFNFAISIFITCELDACVG